MIFDTCVCIGNSRAYFQRPRVIPVSYVLVFDRVEFLLSHLRLDFFDEMKKYIYNNNNFRKYSNRYTSRVIAMTTIDNHY